jgi:hypothetical protein
MLAEYEQYYWERTLTEEQWDRLLDAWDDNPALHHCFPDCLTVALVLIKLGAHPHPFT